MGRSLSRLVFARTVVLVGSFLLGGGSAFAADPPAAPAPGVPPSPPAPEPPPGGPPAAMPPPTAASPADAAPAAPADLNPTRAPTSPAGVVSQQPAGDRLSSDHSYGVGGRLRLVSVPSWMLNIFTKKNVPLLSGAFALEGYRRGENYDLVLSGGYQNMSPGDGNWLGRGKLAAEDTDFVQFRGLSLLTLDVSFIWRTMFNDWFGLHYGAGIGVGIFMGKMLRTSNSGCTEANAGDIAACHPAGVICDANGCNEPQLKNTEGGGVDEVGSPHRFVDGNIPGAIPIVNVVVGATFKIPQLRGWEAKLEGGFYDAFFFGGGIGYVFY